MSDDKSSISQAQTYQEIGRFWDTHDITDYWDQTEAAEFRVDLKSVPFNQPPRQPPS